VGDLEERARAGEEVSSVERARAAVGIGELDVAFPFLEDALAEGDRNLVTLWTDPAWDVLRSDPRFKEILVRVRESSPNRRFPLPDPPWPLP